jgi:hypothetical protein
MAFIKQTKENGVYISIFQHTNPLSPNIESLSIEDFEIILELSANALQSLHTQASSLQFQEILNKKILEAVDEKNRAHELIVKQINNNYKISEQDITNKTTYEINKLNKKISELQNSLEQSIQSYQNLNQNFLNLQNSSNESIQKIQNSSSESTNKIISNITENLKQEHLLKFNMIKEQLDEKKEENMKLKNDLNTSRNEVISLLEKNQKQALIQQNSSKKGKQGEMIFEELVEQHTNWKLDDTSKTSKSGDRHATIDDCKILFEIKNYSYTVPYEQVVKFKNDMDNYKDKQLGIFISHNSRIAKGDSELLYCEINSNNQLLVYIQKFLSFDPETIFPILNNFINLAKIIYRKNEESLLDTDLQSKIDSIKPILKDLTTDINKSVNTITNIKDSWIQKINTDCSNMKNNLSKLFDYTKKMIHILFPEETTNSNMVVENEESSVEAPPKKKTNRSKKITPNASLLLES